MATPQTVFVTGASGFIAKHIILKLLNAGFHVIGSVRSLNRADEVRDAVAPHLDDAGGLDERLRFVALNLSADQGWDTALQEADILMHTASPFPMVQTGDAEVLIRPAVDGALRALNAAKAAGIGRVVLTSSSVAVMNTRLPAGRNAYSEDDWTDLDDPNANAYVTSKTLAEQAAWEFVRTEAPGMDLTVINPVLVLGPPLDRNYGTSIKLIERVLKAADPMIPQFGFPVVDVRDIAEMHVRALTRPGTGGKRFIGVDRFVWFHEMAGFLRATYPDRKIVTRRAPNIVVRFLSLFDASIRSILPILGKRQEVSNARAADILGMVFIPAEDSVRATAAYLVDNRLV